jgi:Flp pilus assembly protein TadD
MNTKQMEQARQHGPGSTRRGLDGTGRLGLVALAVAGLGFGFTCQADAGERPREVPKGYELVVLEDRAHGDLLLRGQYRRAAAEIASGQGISTFEAATNLCVAHIMLGELQAAWAHCERSVDRAEQRAEKGARPGHDYRRDWVAALSNRGVLRARSGDPAGARADFEAALAVKANAPAPERNLALFTAAQNGTFASN